MEAIKRIPTAARDDEPWRLPSSTCESSLMTAGSHDGAAAGAHIPDGVGGGAERTSETDYRTDRTELAAPSDQRADGIELIADAEVAARSAIASGRLREALETLMSRHGDAVYTHALRILDNRDAAKDVLQQTFLAAYRDLPTFAGRSSFKTWLFGIATHRALDLVRQQRRAEKVTVPAELAQIEPAMMPSPSSTLDARQRVLALEECLQRLSPEIRATLLMRFQQDLRYDEIARHTGERSGTLHARVTRALPVLRRCLEDKGIES
jgi:RNA polymerase sigma factor (sigma-70 family)